MSKAAQPERRSIKQVARSWLLNAIGLPPTGAWGPMTIMGFDRTLGGGSHALDPLDGTGFQRNLAFAPGGSLPIVAAIHHLYASAFAQLRPTHVSANLDTGDLKTVQTSAASRLLVQPNSYESFATTLSRLAVDWLSGEALIWAPRNGRSEPDELHLLPRGTWTARMDPDSRAIFYVVTHDEELLVDPDPWAVVPRDVSSGRAMVLRAEDCLHLRWKTPRHPLVGESAFAEAGLAAGVNVALSRAQLAFCENMRRVSAVLSTEQQLNEQQIVQLRQKFDEQAKKWQMGGIPILGSGTKLTSVDLTTMDASIIDALRYSNEEIARCAGVPPPMYGDLTSGTISSSEVLVRHWLSVSLGGLIERLERELERLFGMDGRRDYIDLSTEALLRSDLATQASAYAQMVQGGVMKSNETRALMGLGPAPGGDQLLVQQQMVPIELSIELAKKEIEGKAAAAKRAAEPPPPTPQLQEPAEPPPKAPDEQPPVTQEQARSMRDQAEAMTWLAIRRAREEARAPS